MEKVQIYNIQIKSSNPLFYYIQISKLLFVPFQSKLKLLIFNIILLLYKYTEGYTGSQTFGYRNSTTRSYIIYIHILFR